MMLHVRRAQLLLAAALFSVSSFAAPKTISVMAPLLIGNPAKPDAEESLKAWDSFRANLTEAKKLGAYAVSTDVWWGLVEPVEGKFDWAYYHRVADAIAKAGLKWVPILSTHQCGGNVGDDVNVLLPDWIWKSSFGPHRGEAFAYVSEHGNISHEAIAPWGTQWTLPLYRRLFESFQKEFAKHATNIAEVNVSLGPSGELRYPSYNSHDKPHGDYPTRGALQAYSPLAEKQFRTWLAKKYATIESLNSTWGTKYVRFSDVKLPEHWGDKEGANGLLGVGILSQPIGVDFFAWYQDSLIRHGQRLLSLAEEVFWNRKAPFRKIDIGGKVPGIHWRAGGDRLAELAAGMIRANVDKSWTSDSEGHGYRELLSVFRSSHGFEARRVLHFSCAEKSDKDGEPEVKSLAKTLTTWVGEEAKRQGIPLRGENALAGSLKEALAWDNMTAVLKSGLYDGLTILRMSDVVGEGTLARERFQELTKTFSK